MTISDVAIRRPVFTLVIMLAITVLGLMSFRSLGTDLFPDVNFPVVTVTTFYPGASPSEVERQVSKVIEDSVSGINGLDTVRSFSRESMSSVVVIFKLSTDINQAATDVREKIAAIRDKLPEGIKDPNVRRLDVSAAPVLVYVANGAGMADEEVRRITDDQLRPQVERVPGVAAINIIGGPSREVQVLINRAALGPLNLSLTGVIDTLKAQNLNVPAGHYDDGPREIAVRLRGDRVSAKDVGDIVIATSSKGTQIHLREIAEVRDGFEEMRTRIRANGKAAVAFEVQKQSGANTIQVAQAVMAKLDEIKSMLPKGYDTRLILDTSELVLENTRQVEEDIVFGGSMAILVILLFMLDWRSTFISSLALPVSVIGTFFILDLLGQTLNMMTLMGLSLSIGLLIDDAVVVRESIFRRLELGEDPVTAASKGTQEIALAVLATTLTVVAVFIPVAFMKGVVGQFFKAFGYTVTAAVLLSLLVAFTLDPMLSAKLATKIDHTKKRFILVRMMEAFHQFYEDIYVVILRFATRFRILTVGVAVAALWGSLQLLGLLGSDFVSPEDRAQYMVNIELPSGTSLTETQRLVLPAELGLLENPEIVTVYAKLGPNTEVNKAELRVITTPKEGRAVTLFQIQDETRALLQKLLPGAKVSITPPGFVEGMPEGAPLQIQVRGNDIARLEKNAMAVEHMVRQIAGVSDIRVEYSPGRPEQLVSVDDRKAAAVGVPRAVVARALRAGLEGEDAGTLRMKEGDNREVKVRVRLQESDRTSVKALGALPVGTPKGIVPLRELIHSQPGTGPQVIDRQDRSRQIVVSAVPAGRSLGEILTELEPSLVAYDFGEDGYYRLDGQVKQMRETGEGIGIALILGVLFIFLILAAQFESFVHPFTIMLSLPMAFVGAFVALFYTDLGMAMGSNIGIILLMGLVTKNGIMLVDAALTGQRAGMTPRDAVIEAGRKRLRPILMTSAAMVLGMLPTALSTGSGSEFRAPMAVAVIGGVISSTLLTLLVVPAVYLWVEKLQAGFRWIIGLFRPRKVTKVVASLGMALVLGGGLYAGFAKAESEAPLTLDLATERAIAASRDLRVLEQQVKAAEVARKRVFTAWMPEINLIGTYTHNSDEASFDFGAIVGGIGAALGVPLPTDGLPPPTVIQKKDTVSSILTLEQTLFAWSPIELERAATLGIDARRMGSEVVRRELRFAVAQVFYNVQGLDRLIAAAQRAIELADTRLADAQHRQKLGAGVDLDLLRAELERTRGEQSLALAEQGRMQLLETLGILTDQPAPAALAPAPPVEPVVGTPTELAESAVLQRPEIQARRRAMQATEVLVREAELRWLPLLTLSANARVSDTEGFTGENWSWALSLNLVVPLFDRGTRYAELHERQQELETQQAEIDVIVKQVGDGIRRAQVEVRAAERTLVTATRQTELARKAAALVQRAFKAGGVTSIDVHEADASVRIAEENEANLRWRKDLAVLVLRHAAGL